MVVGSGTRFLSGISVYTLRLANALAASGARVSLLTMRQLLPTRFYPGRGRVGTSLTDLDSDPRVATYDGVDWYWLPSLLRAILFIGRQRPEVLILQWWTGTVLHTYLALSLVARLFGAKTVVEFHEVQDTGELRLPLVGPYARLVGRAVIRLASAFVVHSEFDRNLVAEHWPVGGRPVTVIHHGPYDHLADQPADRAAGAGQEVLRDAPTDVCNVLFFGTIRPYKGLEDLVDAFDSLGPEEVADYWLTVVGETWEGWTLPAEKIERSRWRDRITFVNRYVHDSELHAYLAGADAVCLPYLRSSISGPLHVAMSYGVPVIITPVGGNAEASEQYSGIHLVPVHDPAAIASEIRSLRPGTRERHASPASWDASVRAYLALAERLTGRPVAPLEPVAARAHGRTADEHLSVTSQERAA
jgi:glycosyltransferase involved in cell wall biosynthesis